MSGRDQQRMRESSGRDAPTKSHTPRRFPGVEDSSRESSAVSCLQDIKLLRLGWSSVTFEEWKTAMLEILRIIFGDLARSLHPNATGYYKPALPDLEEYTSGRMRELEDNFNRARAVEARAQAATRSRSTRGNTAGATSSTATTAASTAATTESEASTVSTTVATENATAAEARVSRWMRLIDEEYRDMSKDVRSAIAAMERNRVKMFASIWTRMSRESQERVKMSSLHRQLETMDDPLSLWQAILDTHSMYLSGNSIYDANLAWQQWYNLRQQPHQGLAFYKSTFDAAYDEIAARVNEDKLPDEQTKAIQFVTSLDPNRFAELQVTYRNKIKAYPPSLQDAYLVATEWVTLAKPQPLKTANQAAFHIKTSGPKPMSKRRPAFVEDPPRSKDKQQGARPLQKGKPRQKSTSCFACKKNGHYASDCPIFKSFLQTLNKSEERALTAVSHSAEQFEDESDTDSDHFIEDFARRVGKHHVTYVISSKHDDVTIAAPTQCATGNETGPATPRQETVRGENETDMVVPVRQESAPPAGDTRGEASKGQVTMMTITPPSSPRAPTAVLLDNQATQGVFGNGQLLTSIKKNRQVHHF